MKRRKFLKALGIGAAAVTMAPDVLAKVPDMFNINREAPATAGDKKLRLSFYPYELQLRHTFTVAEYSRTTTPDVQVEIEYDGIKGYGEASMPQYLGESVASVTAFLKKVDLSRFTDPFQMEDIMAYLDTIQPKCMPGKAAVDIALHDVIGKLLGAPWYKIWGFNKTKCPSTTFTIGMDKPEVVVEKTRECAGKFNILKVKLGGGHDKEMIQSVRKVTNVPLTVDVNQGWTDRQFAIDMIHWLKEQGVVMVEQPLPKNRIDDIAWITEHSPLPIFADEMMQGLSDVLPMKGVVNGINIKLMKCGGMHDAYKMYVMARSLGMRVMVGCMTETSCAVSAAAQLSPVTDFADLDGNLLIKNDLFEGMIVNKGKITLPDRPGIGLKKL